VTKSAYTYDEAAAEVGLSKRAIEREVAENRLAPSYYRSKPIIRDAELQRWLEELPTEKPSAA
jgi:excisionase family DNA binding protein